jgi:hypothetical protein
MRTDAAATDRFYAELSAFDEFDRVTDPAAFSRVPGDWHVVVADIKGSTLAIAEGRYKEVNMVGAACITAVTNVALGHDGVEIPYVFGGDGATLLVPGSMIAEVRRALLGAAVLARREFGFELRIGSVPVSDIRSTGLDVTVGKLRLSPGNELAQLGGGGIAEADHLIKAEPETGGRYRLALDPDAPEPDMSGLSCRWEPLRAERGVILCMMARALDEDETVRRRTYDGVLADVATALGGDIRAASPVTPRTMRFKWIPKGLRMEAKITKGRGGFLRRYLFLLYESLIQFFLEKFDKSAGGYDAPVYRAELRANSDFRRFDDVLRLVLDCTQTQADAIAEALYARRAAGEIAFGLHSADHALMTCLVFNLEAGEHVHFIDGGLGGFTEAAVGFKKQMRDTV